METVRKPAAGYSTQLSPLDEMAYRQWVADHGVPTNPDATAPQDYDMRGFYQGLQQQNPRAQSAIDPNDSKLHYPDFWKTPLHQTLSNESQWAPPNAPSWTDDDKLVQPNGRVVFDDRNQPSDAERLLIAPKKRGGSVSLTAHVNEQIRYVNHNPTDGQKKAGNYQKGHIRLHGLDISVENRKGSWRSGMSLDGKKWRSKLPYHYGYIKRTTGADGDHVDVCIGPHLASPHVFVIDQHNLHGGRGFDEHKVFVGFASEAQARKAYIAAFSDGKGSKRIGHIAHMTIDGFKDWLRNGNTLKAVKRAEGGRVGYAGGGAPPFEATSDVPPFEATQELPSDAGKMDAAWRGARAGATFNFGDEISGARANAPKVPGTNWNIPDFVGPIPARTIAGAARTGYGYLTGNKDITDPYEKARDEERKADEAAKVNHPYISAGAELAGAIPSMAALPELGAARGLAPAASGIARFGARALDSAATAGGYGMLSGAGEGDSVGDRAVKAATGLVSGIVGGAVGQGVGEGMGAIASHYGTPIVQTVRGWMDPNGEAARRLASALRADQEMITAGTAQGMTPQQWAAARARGEPVTLADLGSGRTQALLRSAANTSPEGRAQLEQVLENRFLAQNERVADTFRNALPQGRANADKSADQIVAEYDRGRVPAYRAAYAQGDRPLMSPAMERMMSSDTFVNAMRKAISSGKDRDVAQGLGGFNPMVNVTPDGRVVFNKGAKGVPTYPNLQYWDQVKRELDAGATMAKRSGDTANVSGDLARMLRNELDQQVPSYAHARGIAEQYFGESNALEAGQKLAGKKMDPVQVRKILAQMKPDERALFQEGYASDMANRVIGNIGKTTNLVKGRGILSSPNEEAMARAILGPGGYAQVEARMHLERIMDGARQAMGNSTTARQLIEAGLAGGAAGYAMTGDPWGAVQGAAGLATARGAAGKLLSDQIRVGAKHLIGKVDASTARRVAELLTSNDPRQLRAGYQMAARSNRIMQGLRNIAARVGVVGQTAASRPAGQAIASIPYRGANLGPLQGPSNANAGDEQQRP
ncbi:MAG TPA: hypothetical protein VKQ27_04995 [Acetobacteraceae bacterium]|nr:hypothetical protein [Acetobacteraceae bacterium]